MLWDLKVVDNVFSLTPDVDPIRVTTCRSMLGDYQIQLTGILENPDVLQLSTPASIRNEHPIATLVSWTMETLPDYNTIQRLANSLRVSVGSFSFGLLTKNKLRAIVVLRNMYVDWDDKAKTFVKTKEVVNKVYLFVFVGTTGSETIDCIDADIPCGPEGRRLYLLASHTDSWAQYLRPRIDMKITYKQLNYKYDKKIVDIPTLVELLVDAVRFVNGLEDPRVTAIVMGLDATNCDLLTANTLTRLMFIMSQHKLQLELPVYDHIIRTRVANTN